MAEIKRRKARIIKIGNVRIGGNYPIAIQSMAKTRTCEIEKTIRQIKELESAGCEIVRVAVKDKDDARAISKIKRNINIPLVADIHFDWRLAIEAIDSGVDKIRLNPGNIYKRDQVREVSRAAKLAGIPIRVGLNSGSIGRSRNQVDKMVSLCRQYIKILEDFCFYDIVISLKAQNVSDTVEAYRRMAKFCDYPMHLGVTATGLQYEGLIKSSIAIGTLLLEGIGDTIRISLTDRPQKEVRAARCLLKSLGLGVFAPEIISCPTCGRCEVDLVKIVKRLENSLASYPVSQLASLTGKPANRQTGKSIKVAVMGCVVNGPGEAKHADLGIAFGRKEGLLFRKGKTVKKVSADRCVSVLLEEIRKIN